MGGFGDENESIEFGDSLLDDVDWDEEYEDDIGLLNMADLGGLLTPDENIKLDGLLLLVDSKAVGVYEGDDNEEKYRDLASAVGEERELVCDMPFISYGRLSVILIGIETLCVSEEVECCFPDMKGDKLENLLNREPDSSSIFPQ